MAIVTPSLPTGDTATPRAPTAIARDRSVAELTRGMAAGDEEAFSEFHHRYFDRLLRHLLRLTRGEEAEAKDALQETLCRVVRYVRRFDDEEVFWCWLTALARSAVRDAGRKRRRYWRLLENYVHRWLPLRPEPAPEYDLRLEDFLAACLSELDAADRALVEGKYLGRVSVRDLAEGAGLTEKAVESRLLRLRRKLRERLIEKMREHPL